MHAYIYRVGHIVQAIYAYICTQSKDIRLCIIITTYACLTSLPIAVSIPPTNVIKAKSNANAKFR